MPLCELRLSNILSLLPLFCCDGIYAQDIPDSLQHKLNQATNESVKSKTLSDMGEVRETIASAQQTGN